MAAEPVVVVGAGIGGLAAAAVLAARGRQVTVLERAATPGGKLREVEVGPPGARVRIDAGPTVLTMRWVFEDIFAAAGGALDTQLPLEPCDVLSRNAWPDGATLDLYADERRSADSIARLASPAEGRRYRDFCARARRVYETLRDPFIRAQRPSLPRLMREARLADLLRISPYTSLWAALGEHFRDARLRQLFARYSTYCGSSPFAAPATLMLIAHVERQGVWLPAGGMHAIARSLAGLAQAAGARFRYGTEATELLVRGGRVAAVRVDGGDELPAGCVVVNADVAAVGAGLLGAAAARAVAPTPRRRRSLSALTWCLLAEPRGLPLVRHVVCHSGDAAAEFADLFGHRCLPRAPTVYFCAQDRGGTDGPAPRAGPERLLAIVNAPAEGDARPLPPDEIAACEAAAFRLAERCGLVLAPAGVVRTTPADFHALFPATGGALYGPASHGWTAAFRRAAARTRLPGLYLAGGSVHPGAGLPMAALSGLLAACSILAGDAARGARPA